MIKNLIVVMMGACCFSAYGMMDMWTPKPNQNPSLQQRNIKYDILTEEYAETLIPELSTLPVLQQEYRLQKRYDITTALVRLYEDDGFGEPDFVTDQEFWDTKRAESLAKLVNLRWKLNAIERQRLREQTIITPNPPAAQAHDASLHHKRRCTIL
jgi:hypothetical protein